MRWKLVPVVGMTSSSVCRPVISPNDLLRVLEHARGKGADGLAIKEIRCGADQRQAVFLAKQARR